MFYVYELIDPSNNKPFYIGKGKDNRMYVHYIRVKNGYRLNNRHLHNKLQQLISNNQKPIYNKIIEHEDEKLCLQKEEEKIAKIGLKNLCNLTSGGEGESPSLETRKKISKIHKNRKQSKTQIINRVISRRNNNDVWKTMNGKTHSEKTKNQMSKSAMGKNNSMYGQSLFDLWAKKFGENIAKERYAEYCERCRNSQIKRFKKQKEEENV